MSTVQLYPTMHAVVGLLVMVLVFSDCRVAEAQCHFEGMYVHASSLPTMFFTH